MSAAPSVATTGLWRSHARGACAHFCRARRTAHIAADLVDRVLPEAPYRQWVLTFPFPLRFLLATDPAFLASMLAAFTKTLATDPAFLASMLAAFTKTLFAWQRLRGRRLGIRDGQTGSVTMIRRFGKTANLNPHFH